MAHTVTPDDEGGAEQYGTLVEWKSRAGLKEENPVLMQLCPFKVSD
jgi:hypothetical protein